MALTQDRLRTTTATIESPASERLSNGRSLGLGLAWLVLIPVAIALEPAPAQTTVPLWEQLAALVQLGALGVTAAGLALRSPWAAGAALATALMFTAAAFACPATGHHQFGLSSTGPSRLSIANSTPPARR